MEEATKLSLKILKSVMEEKISVSNVQVVTITPGAGYVVIPEAELVEVVASLA